MPRESSYNVDAAGTLTLVTQLEMNPTIAATFAAVTGTPAVVTAVVNGPIVTFTVVITPDAPVAVAFTDSIQRDLHSPSS